MGISLWEIKQQISISYQVICSHDKYEGNVMCNLLPREVVEKALAQPMLGNLRRGVTTHAER